MKNNKTALDELTEWVHDKCECVNGCLMIGAEDLEKKIAELRATTEKKLFIDCYTAGQASGYNADWENQEMDIPEDWYNETYGQK